MSSKHYASLWWIFLLQEIPTSLPFYFWEKQTIIFNETYSNKSIITGRSIQFRDFEEHNLENFFNQMGWTKFIEIDEIYYPNLIRIF